MSNADDQLNQPAPPEAAPPTFTPVGAMPLAPARPRNWRSVFLAGGVVVALLVALGGYFVVRAHFATAPADAGALLRQASQAHLRDATYTIGGNLTASVTGVGSISEPLAGNGTIIRTPYQQHMTVQVGSTGGLTGVITEEAIISDNIAYTRTLNGNNTSSNTLWTKTDAATLSAIPGLNAVDLLDYSTIQHPVIVGEETINGHKTWHVRGDLNTPASVTATATVVPGQVQAVSKGTEDLWLREDNKYPAQVTLHLTLNASAQAASLAGNLDLTETSTFTQWNTGVVITPPPPNQVQG